MIRFLLAVASAEEPPAAPAPAPPAVNAQTAVDFADHLLRSGDAFSALSWYRLADFLQPAPQTAWRIGLAYEHGSQFEAAAYSYGQLATAQAGWRAAVCQFHAGSPQMADLQLAELPALFPGTPEADRADYLRGVLALKQHDLSGAQERFAMVSGPLAPRASELAAAASSPIPYKSPALATTLSFIPGLGQLYTGHIGDGVIAMVVSGGLGLWSGTLLATGISESRPGLTAAGGVLAGMTVVTWSSNLVGAYSGAVRFNTHAARRQSEALLEEAWMPELALEPPLPE